MKKLLIYLFVFSFITVSTTSCMQEKNDEELKILSWNLSKEPETLDPTLNGSLVGATVIKETFEGLVRENEGIISPGIAESWEISEDAKSIIFHLRKSNWSDGSPLTSKDFMYSWFRAMDPTTGSEYAWIWEYTNIVGAYEYVSGEVDVEKVGIIAPDDYTLVLNLKRPTQHLLSLLSLFHFMPVKEEIIIDDSNKNWSKEPDLAISNGPFILEEFTIGNHLKLKKNPNYWDAQNIVLDGINLPFVGDENTAFQAYSAGELMASPNLPSAMIPILQAEDNEFYTFPLLGTYFLNINLDHDLWKDIRIREAFNLAIDRKIITYALGDGGKPASSLVSPGFIMEDGSDFYDMHQEFSIPQNGSGYDKARQLLADAGYPDGEGFPHFEILYNSNDTNTKIAVIIQEMFHNNLGINATLTQQEWAVYLDSKSLGEFDLAKGSWITDFIDPIGMLTIFTSDNPKNSSHYTNPIYDDLILKASLTTGSVHYNYLAEAEQVLMDDLPFIPIYHYTDTWVISDQVINWKRSPLGVIDFSRADIIDSNEEYNYNH